MAAGARAVRAGPQDWVDAGLTLLRDGGEDALTLERLCLALGKTKGSFYHHFDDIEAYHAALLEYWARLHTELPIEAAEKPSERSGRGGTQRRRALYQAVRKVDLGLERAVHAWAVRSEVARAACDRVHQRRIGYLTALRAGQRDARVRAEIEYAAFLGALHLYPTDAARRDSVSMRLLSILA